MSSTIAYPARCPPTHVPVHTHLFCLLCFVWNEEMAGSWETDRVKEVQEQARQPDME